MDTEQIAQITVKGTSEGMDKVKSDLEGVSKAQDDLAQKSTAAATVTETVAKKHLDASSAYDRLHNSLDVAAGATESFGKRQALINTALEQGHITQAQAAADLVLLAERYPKAAQAQETLGNGLTKLESLFAGNAAAGTKSAEIATLLEGRQLKLASSVGLVGEVLSVIGPAGLAAAAGVGAVVVAMDLLSKSAERMGEVAKEVGSFSAVTGISTDAVQALRSEGTKFGLSMEQTGTAIERFTYSLDAAHSATGPLYDQIQKINPALSTQLALSKSTGDALNILAKAYSQAGDEAQKAALVRAAAGRNAGPEFGGLLLGIADKGGVAGVTSEVNRLDLITKDQIEHWKTLSAQIEEGSSTWRNNIASIFTGAVLESQKEFEDTLVSISREMKSFSQSDAFGGMVTAFRTVGDILKTSTVPLQYLWQLSGKVANAIPTVADMKEAQPQATDFSTRFGNANTAIQNAGPNFSSRFNDNAAQIKAANDLAAATDLLTAAQEKYSLAQRGSVSLQESGTASENQLLQARKNEGSALQFLADAEKQNIAVLGGAATGEEVLQQRTDALTASFLQGAISADTYNRALHGDTAKQVSALEDQLRIVKATTDQGKLAAQYAKDYNDAKRAAKSDEDASVIAAGKRAISEVAVRDAAMAWQQTMLGVGPVAQQIADSAQATADAYQAAQKAAQGIEFGRGGDFGNFNVPAGAQNVSVVRNPSFTSSLDPNSVLARSGIDAAISAAERGSPGGLGVAGTGPDINTVSSLFDLKNSQTNDSATKIANLNQEVAWLNTLPETIARDQQIVSLMNSIDQLNKSTNSLNSTNQSLLSPYYTQDPRTSHIGFRSQGMATGGEFTVPGGYSANDNMTVQIPVASGEVVSVRRPGQTGGGGTTISINMPVTIQGNASKDEVGRTLYQAGQNIARQLAATSR